MLPFLLALLAAAQAAPSDPDLLREMQALEASRNAAIRTGDSAALERLYAADFQGVAASGVRVDRPALLAVFARNAGGDFVADSEVLDARIEDGLVLVEGRLRLHSGDRARLLSDSLYLHVFRRGPQGWEMLSGAAVPVAAQRRDDKALSPFGKAAPRRPTAVASQQSPC